MFFGGFFWKGNEGNYKGKSLIWLNCQHNAKACKYRSAKHPTMQHLVVVMRRQCEMNYKLSIPNIIFLNMSIVLSVIYELKLLCAGRTEATQ